MEKFLDEAREKEPLLHTEKTTQDIVIESYLSDLVLTDGYREEFASLVEDIPELFYPLDLDLSGLVRRQREVLLRNYGMERSVHPVMDDDGIETPPPSGRKWNIRLFLAGFLLFDVTNITRCRQALHREIRSIGEELEELAEHPIDIMDMESLGKEIGILGEILGRIGYVNYRYAYYPGRSMLPRCGWTLKKINFTYHGEDLLQNLNDRSAVIREALRTMAKSMEEDPELKEAVLGGADYGTVCREFPEVQPLFEAFLDKHGYHTERGAYCITERSYHEDPDRMMRELREILSREKEEDEIDGFMRIMYQAKKKLYRGTYQSFENRTRYLRNFFHLSSDLEYLWETVFFYMRKVLSRIAYLTTEDPEITHSIGYLTLDEVLEVCRRGSISREDLNRIIRRTEKRPYAEKIWAYAKEMILEEPE